MKNINRRESPRIDIKLRCHVTSPALWAQSAMYTENISRSGVLIAWRGAEAAGAALPRGAVEGGRVGGGVGDVEDRAVDAHQPQPVSECTGRLGPGQRMDDLLEQLADRSDAQALPSHAQAGPMRGRLADAEPADLEQCFGVFHSPKDARKALTDIAKAKRLCLKMLGLEEAEGSCLAHQLGNCKGVCVGKEPAALHAVRVRMALTPLKLKSWPFPGRIALIERGAMGSVDSHVLDHWAYLGTARSEEDLAGLLASP